MNSLALSTICTQIFSTVLIPYILKAFCQNAEVWSVKIEQILFIIKILADFEEWLKQCNKVFFFKINTMDSSYSKS